MTIDTKEPDAIDFDAHRLPCVMRRGPGGHWCGYVGIPAGHPWFGKHYSDAVKVPRSVIDRTIDVDKVGAVNAFCAGVKNNEETLAAGLLEMVMAVDVHGGLTWAANRPGGGADAKGHWWLGFDCAHFGDAARKDGNNGTYRDAAYVRAECESLAGQLAAIAKAEGR